MSGQLEHEECAQPGRSVLEDNKTEHSAFTDSTYRAEAPNDIKNKYQYTDLANTGTIRLLQLRPSHKNDPRIDVELIEYSLLPSAQAMHLYEALSYSWGNADFTEKIFVDSREFFVTKNLFEALVCLRDCQVDRLLWIDAVCINQASPQEKKNQIPLMPSIYSMASRVIIWLGTANPSEDQAFEVMSFAAEEMVDENTMNEKGVRESILSVLKREWFKRIWVVQEVAAARSIMVQCGSNTISGHAFSVALNSKALESIYKASPELKLQTWLRPTTYLMRRAVFRSRTISTTSSSNTPMSLGIRPIGELIDMYHYRKASYPNDRVFALLGMSSDGHSLGSLIDYDMDWRDLFLRLVALLLNDKVSINISDDGQRAFISGKGSVLGKVCSVQYDGQDDQQRAMVLLKNTTGHLGSETAWVLPPSAKPVQVGDLICLLQETKKCMVVRLGEDLFFSIIMIAAHAPHEEIREFQHSFSLVWDWDVTRRDEQNVKGHEIQRSDAAWLQRQWDAVSILEDGERYDDAKRILQAMLGTLPSDLTEYDRGILATLHRLALVHIHASDWDEARKLLRQEVRARSRLQGTSHPDTLESRRSLAAAYKANQNISKGKLQAVLDILEGDDDTDLQQRLAQLARAYDQEVVELCLDLTDSNTDIITEDVVVAAAGNELRGDKVMHTLLSRSAKVRVTEHVTLVAVKNRWTGKQIIQVLFRERPSDIRITQDLFTATSENKRQGGDIRQLLREYGGKQKAESNIEPLSQVAKDESPWQLDVGSSYPTGEQTRIEVLPPPAEHWELIHGEPTLDVIAIHGLGGDLYKTWTYESRNGSKVLWLNELLMEKLPRTRVMTFGYMMHDGSRATIKDHAEAFLACLALRRHSVTERPIVLVGHDIGGLIIKKALHITQYSQEFGDIGNQIRGVVFFSTPHHGYSVPSRLLKIFARAWGWSLKKPTFTRSLDAFQPGSLILTSINEQFIRISDKYAFCNFHAQHLTLMMNSPIVDKSSAIMGLQHESNMMLGGSHSTICKFRYNDPRFEIVWRAIDMLSRGRQPGVARTAQR